MMPTPDTLKLILEFEVGGGEAYYNANLKRPEVPGGASGVTIGVGYDLGYNDLSQFVADWKSLLPPDDFAAFTGCLGLTDDAARHALAHVRTIEVSWSKAYSVFVSSTIPRYWRDTLGAFPAAESLSGDCQGALLSLVFNRGSDMTGSRRLEMRQIRDALAAGQPEKLPALLRAMIRLWAGMDIEAGMRRRRNAEAALFEQGLAAAPIPSVPTGGEEIPALPTLGASLKLGSTGDQVKALQKTLAALGFDLGPADGDFGMRTDSAVRAFQRKAGLTVDGEVGPLTWKVLGGRVSGTVSGARTAEEEKREKLATFAETEAAKGYRWTPNSEAEAKILAPLREPMRRIGDIGNAIIFYDWCAAFVLYCARSVAYVLPDQPEHYGSTMALVQSWKFWASAQGVWYPRGTITPKRGDIVCFEWGDGDAQLDHIGIVRGYTSGSTTIETAEGNVGNLSRSADMTRSLSTCAGFIRLK